MADVTPRFCWDNIIRASGVAVSASSYEGAKPKWNTQDQSRARTWQSLTGWNIVTGINDKIDITEGFTGDAVATLASGNYATGALMATQVATAINNAATDNTWTCTYDTGTKKFTIGHDNVQTGALEWATGASTATTAGPDLGYDVSADDTGGASYVGDDPTYHTREWVVYDLGSAVAGDMGSVFDQGTLGTGGTIKIQANATDAWTSPSFDQTLAAGDYFYTDFFASTQTYRYWRVYIEDTQNTNGFNKLSYVNISEYFQPSMAFRFGYTVGRDEITEFARAYQGHTFVDENSTLFFWDIDWIMTTADKTTMTTMLNTVKRGFKFIFAFDPQNTETDQELVYLTDSISFRQLTPTHWRIGFTIFREHG